MGSDRFLEQSLNTALGRIADGAAYFFRAFECDESALGAYVIGFEQRLLGVEVDHHRRHVLVGGVTHQLIDDGLLLPASRTPTGMNIEKNRFALRSKPVELGLIVWLYVACEGHRSERQHDDKQSKFDYFQGVFLSRIGAWCSLTKRRQGSESVRSKKSFFSANHIGVSAPPSH